MPSDAEARPSLIILGGPNGAGKTTVARTLLAETLKLTTFVNADTIAQGLSGFDLESVAVEAGRVMLKRIKELAAHRRDFAFETTMAGHGSVRFLQQLRGFNYHIDLVYLWLNDADLAVLRVRERVRLGGHGVPEATIRQRYYRGQRNFSRLYRPLADQWRVYDNSGRGHPRLVAEGTEGHELVFDAMIWERLVHGAVQ